MLDPRAILRHLLEQDEPLPPEPPEVQGQQQQELGLSGDPDDIDSYLLDPSVATERYLKNKPLIKGYGHHGLFDEWNRKWFRSGRPRRDGNELRRKLENNTWAVYTEGYTPEKSFISIRLHSTDILTVYPDDKLVARMGGWNTVTTRDRMNRNLPGSWGVYSFGGSAYWYNNGVPAMNSVTGLYRIPFTSGDTILPDGTLEYQAEHEFVRRKKSRDYYVHLSQPVDASLVDYDQPEGHMVTRLGPFPSRMRAERRLRSSGIPGTVSLSPEPEAQ